MISSWLSVDFSKILFWLLDFLRQGQLPLVYSIWHYDSNLRHIDILNWRRHFWSPFTIIQYFRPEIEAIVWVWVGRRGAPWQLFGWCSISAACCCYKLYQMYPKSTLILLFITQRCGDPPLIPYILFECKHTAYIHTHTDRALPIAVERNGHKWIVSSRVHISLICCNVDAHVNGMRAIFHVFIGCINATSFEMRRIFCMSH